MSEDNKAKVVLKLANDLIVKCNILMPRLINLSDLNANIYYEFFKSIFNVKLEPKSKCAKHNLELEKYRNLLRVLGEDILSTSLQYIDCQALCTKQYKAHNNLLEIFDACYKYLLSKPQPMKIYTSKSIQTNMEPKASSDVASSPIPSSSTSSSSYEKSPTISSFSICGCPDVIQSTPESCECHNGLQKPKLTSLESAKQINGNAKLASVSTQTPVFVDKPSVEKENLCTNLKLFYQSSKVKKTDKNSDDKVGDVDEKLLRKLERLTLDNFALDIGTRLHEALRLKQKTRQIMQQIESLDKMQNATSTGVRSQRKRGPSAKQRIVKRISPSKQKINPETKLQSLYITDLLPKYTDIPRHLLNVMRKYELQQKKAVDNLSQEIVASESRVTQDVRDAISKQMRRSAIIKRDMKHFENLEHVKTEELDKIFESALMREWRIERARIHKFVNHYHQDVISKLKAAEAKQEKLLKEEFNRRLREQKEGLLEFKKQMKEKEKIEIRKQRLFLDAFETLYNNNFDILKENLNEEQSKLQKRLSHQTTSLRRLQTQVKEDLNHEIRNVCKK